MSNETQQPFNNYPPMPTQAPAKKPSKLKRFGLPVGLLLLGLIIGGVSGASAVPEPVEVVKEVPGPERIVNKTVEKPVTPQTCKTALDLAGQIMTISAEALGYSNDAVQAAARIDASGIMLARTNMDAVTVRLKEIGPKYLSARDSCNAS